MMHNLIKELRELTGAGIMEIKNALAESNNDKDKAVEILRKKGALKAGKKADRVAKEGLVEAYIHPGGRVGVLVELNCETDFVSRTQDFKTLVKDLALHIAAANPLYVSIDQIPGDVVEKEREIYKESASAKAAADKQLSDTVLNKIVEGKLAKYYEETCLLEQPFAKNPDLKIKDLLAQAVGKIGENIQVRRFARYVLGN
jgi:elongation factor Ts